MPQCSLLHAQLNPTSLQEVMGRSGLEGAGLDRTQRGLYGLGVVFLRYMWARADQFSAAQHWGDLPRGCGPYLPALRGLDSMLAPALRHAGGLSSHQGRFSEIVMSGRQVMGLAGVAGHARRGDGLQSGLARQLPGLPALRPIQVLSHHLVSCLANPTVFTKWSNLCLNFT